MKRSTGRHNRDGKNPVLAQSNWPPCANRRAATWPAYSSFYNAFEILREFYGGHPPVAETNGVLPDGGLARPVRPRPCWFANGAASGDDATPAAGVPSCGK